MYQHTAAQGLSLPVKLHVLNRERLRRTAYCKVPLEFTARQFTIKTISTFEEFLQVMELRHHVFQREFARKRFCLRSDRDKFDSNADFLVVVDNEINKIVGCYRLICSKFTNRFYSNLEFEVDDLIQLPGEKVELSRACILREYRNGRVISLLWRGLAKYMATVNAKYFFGCGSVQTMNDRSLEKIKTEFRSGQHYSQDFYFNVRRKYQLNRRWAELQPTGDAEIPSLVRTYLKVGAKICSEPAIDRKFRCADFLMVMDTDVINTSYRDKYQHRIQS